MSEVRILHKDEKGDLVCTAIEKPEAKHIRFNQTFGVKSKQKQKTHYYDLPENVRKAFKL